MATTLTMVGVVVFFVAVRLCRRRGVTIPPGGRKRGGSVCRKSFRGGSSRLFPASAPLPGRASASCFQRKRF